MTTQGLATKALDEARLEAFAGRMAGVLSDGALALLCHLGHRLGLFDTMAGRPPATSEEIARAAGLQERYVREWLGGATTGGIVEHDPGAGTYALPAEHAAVLTRAAGPDNLARTLGFLPLLAQVAGPVMTAFREGGGVPYAAYEDFHATMAEESGEVFDADLVDTILPLADGLPSRLAAGVDAADIGCGRGRAVNLMAQAYPASTFVGYDFSEEAIEAARDEAARMGLPNARFEVCDVATLDVEDGYDLVTAFDAVHDQAHPATVLAAVSRALRPGGTFLMVDIRASSHLHENLDLPWAPFLYTVSLMHCMTVSLALGGDGLGTCWGEQRALGMLDDAGFPDIVIRTIESDPFNNYYVTTKPPATATVQVGR